MDIFTLCGSLRTGSLNAAALRAAAELCPPPGRVQQEPGLDGLPFFNADDEANAVPDVVAAFRARLKAADAILIASPEYASGTSGVLKNALEWLVGGEGMADKPVALISASSSMTGGGRAQAWLAETLTTMGARPAERPADPRSVTQVRRRSARGRAHAAGAGRSARAPRRGRRQVPAKPRRVGRAPLTVND